MTTPHPFAFIIRPSPIHGQGLFTTKRIPRRMKLGELSGVLRPRRESVKAQQKREVMQIVEISQRWALDCTTGNDFRVLNHSCQANCYLRLANRRVEIYSRGPISAGRELTVDYRETMHPGGMGCRCGVPECRSRL